MISHVQSARYLSAGVSLFCVALFFASAAGTGSARAASLPQAEIQRPTAGVTRANGQSRVQCLTVFRVVSVEEDDVLYVREEPRVPQPHEKSNKLIGIPANAQWIEYLGRSHGEWHLVRYLGIVGFSHGKYLSRDFVLCVQQPAGQPL